MKCDRCGRDNPGQLKFCQDCGNRLVSSAARAVEPTPPRGVALSSDEQKPANAEPSQGSIRVRPPAPDFDFTPRPAVASAGSNNRCARCGTDNPADNRFCSECGSAIGDAPAPWPTAPAPGLVASPVVGIAPAETEPDKGPAVGMAIREGNTRKALHELGALLDAGVVPQPILGQIRWGAGQLRSTERVKRALELVLDTDLQMKSSAGEPRHLLERLVIDLCSRGTSR